MTGDDRVGLVLDRKWKRGGAPLGLGKEIIMDGLKSGRKEEATDSAASQREL